MMRMTCAALLAAALLAAPAAMRSAAAQTDKSEAAEKTKKPPTASQLAARARQAKCAAEWGEAKAANKIDPGMKWPQYWSACNKRLKAAGG